MTNWDKVKSRDLLKKALKIRKSDCITTKVHNSDINKFLNLGYEIANPGAKKTELRKKKLESAIFEDTVWLIFHKMGFDYLNEDNDFFIEFKNNSKQIDVIAVDKETVFVVECKCAVNHGTKKDFKTDIEAIHGYQEDVKEEILKQFPGREIKFCFATKNYIMIDEDLKRLKMYNISYLSYETIMYYKDLADYLGTSAKYQLQGNLFAKESIKGLTGNNIPAIKGKMGDKTYFMFAIEPKKLLKLSYILHRHTANIENFPTYQRIIKKERLKSVTQYIKDGGYFPNSLIVSIDGGVKFDPLSNEGEFGSQVGILELPNLYSTMYVIDGQHRLYGYSDVNIETSDVIPVVAFVDMNKDEQVKIFMDINENQKSVSKALRNTLIVDMNWSSDDPKKAQEALMIKIAESLGERSTSPLYERVQIGESSTSDMMTVTTEMLKNAIKESDFLNNINRGVVKEHGTFDKDENDRTYRFLEPFIEKSLDIIKESNTKEWNEIGNLITKNAVIYAQIRIINDIVNIKLKELGVSFVPDNILEIITPMLEKFASIFKTLDEETKLEMNRYGEGGKKKAYEALAIAFNSKEPSFTFPYLENLIDSRSTRNNEEAKKLIDLLESKFILKFKTIFNDEYALIGKEVTNKMFDMKAEYEKEAALTGNELSFDMWDCVSFKELSQILKTGSNWSNILQKEFTGKTKIEVLDMFELLNSAKIKIDSEKPVINKDFEMIKAIFEKYGGTNIATNN